MDESVGRVEECLHEQDLAEEMIQHIDYEYYREHNFPQTPTIFALRTERYNYI